MSQKQIKKLKREIKKAVHHEAKENYIAFKKQINSLRLKYRIRIAVKIVKGKWE